MATDIDLNTVTREDAGTSHSRRMRREGTVPAVVYAAGKDSIKVSISPVSYTHLTLPTTPYV